MGPLGYDISPQKDKKPGSVELEIERAYQHTQVINGDSFTHQCPVCSKKFRYGHSFEPVCTGPSENSDDHEPTVMRLIKIDKRDVNPVKAEAKRHAPMILPEGFVPR